MERESAISSEPSNKIERAKNLSINGLITGKNKNKDKNVRILILTLSHLSREHNLHKQMVRFYAVTDSNISKK